MPTSRTGTGKWKKLAAQAINNAINNQQFTCPICGVFLDYERSKQPNSPEADHIIPHAEGGQDQLDNLRIICRRCNQRLGGRLGRARQLGKPVKRVSSTKPVTSFRW